MEESKRTLVPLRVRIHATAQELSFRKYMYVKEHAERTLFVCGLPCAQAWAEATSEALFSKFGAIEEVVHGTVPSGACRFAKIVFQRRKGLDAVFSALHQEHECEVHADQQPWLRKYHEDRPGIVALKNEAETYMKRLAEVEQEIEALRKVQEKQVDEDGFQLVTYKKGNKGPTTTGPAAVKRAKEKLKKKQKDNFYRFQMRKKKEDKLDELREKFKQDKIQIERMKKSRKFKPFNR